MKFHIVLLVLCISGSMMSRDEDKKNIKAKEEYEKLQEIEGKKKFADLLKAIDKNKDSKIDLFELEAWIMSTIKQSDYEQSSSKFVYYDEDGSKTITWTEYIRKKYNLHDFNIEEMHNETSPSEHTRHFLKAVHLKKRKFQLADMNKDGVLNIDEYVMFKMSRHFPYMASVEIDTILSDFDFDHDGQLDFKEFLGHDHNNTDVEYLKHEKIEFGKYDINKNNKLDRAEIWSWIMPGVPTIANREARRLFAETKGANAEHLNFDSIISKYHLWIRSEATDHGRKVETTLRDEL